MKNLYILELLKDGKRVSPKTIEYYERTMKSLDNYNPEFPTEVVQVYEWLASIKGYADDTVRTMFLCAKSAGNYIEEISGIDENGNNKIPNIFNKVRNTPKRSNKPRRYFSANQMIDIIEACRFRYDRELILTLIDTSCRIGELEGLKGIAVDIENDERERGILKLKGKTGYRNYALDKRICIALKQLAGSDDGYVFKDTNGEPASVGALKLRVRRVIIAAGITGEKLGAHTLRHSDASIIARYTKSPLAVKAILRHDNINTSMRYIHDVEDDMQQEISPLKLISEIGGNGSRVAGNGRRVEPRQITMGEGSGISTEIAMTDPEIVDGKQDYYSDLFPEIAEGINVRPLLKTGDLEMLRRIFVDYSRLGGNHQDIINARELLKRVTRKTK